MPSSPKVAIPEIASLRPVKEGQHRPELASVQGYLEYFGYLQHGAYEAGVLDRPTALALASFQHFHSIAITGIFDVATRKVMILPRCGVPDKPNRNAAFLARCGWYSAELTYAFGSGTADVPSDNERAPVRAAFGTWQALGVHRFREVALSASPHIVILWTNTPHPTIPTALAYANYPPGCAGESTKLPRKVNFVDTYIWTIGTAANNWDIESVALHEIGHIVGLDHSKVSGSVMWESIPSNFTLRTLTTDDVNGYKSLYAKVPQVEMLPSNLAARRVGAARLQPVFIGSGSWVWRQDPRSREIVAPGQNVYLELREGEMP